MRNKAIAFQRFFTLLIISLPQLVFAHSPLVATGYFADDSRHRGLMAVSQDNGENWFYPATINQDPLPTYMRDSSLSKVKCRENICYALGSYYTEDSISMPYMVSSKDFGSTWNYMDPKDMNFLSNKGSLRGLDCAEHICLAAGLYQNQKGTTLPTLFYSQDGEQWENALNGNKTMRVKDFNEGWLNSASCSNKVCIAAGVYTNSAENNIPLVYVTQDAGSTWYQSIMPEDYKEGQLYSTHCEDETCIVVGEYTDADVAQPLIITSNDKAQTWKVLEANLPNDFETGRLEKVSCSGGFCIAVGVYTVDYRERPLLAYTNNSGKTWQYPEDVHGSGLPDDFTDGSFNDAACNSKACMAAGVYYNEEGAHPFIAVSQDKGQTWNFPTSIQQSTPNAIIADGNLAKVSCNEQVCFAVGDFINTVGYEEYEPLLALTKNGQFWFFPGSINDRSKLPPEFLYGHFSGSS